MESVKKATRKDGITKLPNELKKALLDYGISFSSWCRYYGFPRETARNMAAQILYGEWGIAKEILQQLKEDFPQVYDLKQKKKGIDLNSEKWSLIKKDSVGEGRNKVIPRPVAPAIIAFDLLKLVSGNNRDAAESIITSLNMDVNAVKKNSISYDKIEKGEYSSSFYRKLIKELQSINSSKNQPFVS